MNFTLIARDEDGATTQKEFNATFLDDVVGNCGDFLRGCGYYFDELTVINEPEELVEKPREYKSVYKDSVLSSHESFDR